MGDMDIFGENPGLNLGLNQTGQTDPLDFGINMDSLVGNNYPSSFSESSDVHNETQSLFYNQVKNDLNTLKMPINDDLKQIQVNTYYYKKYKAENYILYFIIIVLIIIIIISIIKKRFPFLDDLSYSIIIGIILGFSLLYIMYLLWIIINKDHQIYDEYYYDQYNYGYNENGSDISNNNSSCLKPGKYLDISYNMNDLNDLLKLF